MKLRGKFKSLKAVVASMIVAGTIGIAWNVANAFDLAISIGNNSADPTWTLNNFVSRRNDNQFKNAILIHNYHS